MNNKKQSTEAMQLKKDLLNACMHEAAHLVLLKHAGGDGIITIERNHAESIYERNFIGQVIITKKPEDKKALSMIGVAGYISEILLADIIEDNEIALNDVDAYDYFEMNYADISESDRGLIADMTEETFCDAFSLVKELWSVIEETAKTNIFYDLNIKMIDEIKQ